MTGLIGISIGAPVVSVASTPVQPRASSTRYRPPTRVVTVSRPYVALVQQYDPEASARKHYDAEYAGWFDGSQGRTFFADPTKRGSYNEHSNVYPVGQPYGDDDPAYEDVRSISTGGQLT